MDGKRLTPNQAKKVYESALHIFCVLAQLEAKLRVLDFGPDDRVYVLVAEARTAMHRLSVHAHSLSAQPSGETDPGPDPAPLPEEPSLDARSPQGR